MDILTIENLIDGKTIMCSLMCWHWVEKMDDKTSQLDFVGDHMSLWPISTICSLKMQLIIYIVLWGIGDNLRILIWRLMSTLMTFSSFCCYMKKIQRLNSKGTHK